MYCGFSKQDITPVAGVFLAGNGDKHKSTAVHDSLYVHALVLSTESEWTALVSADLLGIELETVKVVQILLREAGCSKHEHVFISCTHTHNGPHTRFSELSHLRHYDKSYLQRLGRAIADAILAADAAKEMVSMKYARGYAFENFNRRVVMPDGVSRFYAPRQIAECPEIAEHVHGVADAELDTLQFLRSDATPLVTAVHYAAHPLTVGIFKDMITADFPGSLVRNLSRQTRGEAVFFQGACGDLHSKGLFEGFKRMEKMGSNLSREVMRVLDSCESTMEKPTLKVARQKIALPVDQERRKKYGYSQELFGEDYQTEMGAVSIGPIAFVTVPGEILCEPGLQIKWNSPFPQTWVLYNCNGYASYIAHRRAYTEGGYEGEQGQCLAPEACELVLETAKSLLAKVK